MTIQQINILAAVEFFTVLTCAMNGTDNKLQSWLKEYFDLKKWEFDHYQDKWNEFPDPVVFFKRLSPDRQLAILDWFNTKTVRDHITP